VAEVIIERRFRGPPDSANGGYACGTVAAFVEPSPAVEATLRAPPPLNTPLSIGREGGGARMRHGETLVAEARAVGVPDLEVPEPVSAQDAESARGDSPLHQSHPFPQCFVCGSDRPPGDGLGVICGPVPGRELIAAPWETDQSMAGDDGKVRSELVWSVLDCPSGQAIMLAPGAGVTVLGRLTGVIGERLAAGRTYVAIGWPIGRDGRKIHSATAILGPDGEPVAMARAVWIELREQPAGAGVGTR
jgi:hypothetical protein